MGEGRFFWTIAEIEAELVELREAWRALPAQREALERTAQRWLSALVSAKRDGEGVLL
jgi:hypothetical protein